MTMNRMRLGILCLVLLTLGICTGGVSLYAQTYTQGSISGTVFDPTGAVVPNAAILIHNSATNADVRLTSDGKIRTCLFSQVEHDLYGRMRAGLSNEELREYIENVVRQKEQRHHIGEPGFLKPSRSMVHIGG